MDPIIGGALVGGAANLLGGLLSNRSARKQANANIAAQREFAQNSLQWKAADAKKAGIHPIYAMGAPTSSFTPVAINDSMGPALAATGQDISRAMSAGQRGDTRPDIGEFAQAYELNAQRQKLLALQLQGQQLENALKAQEFESRKRNSINGDTQLPPPVVSNPYKANPIDPSTVPGIKPSQESYDVGGKLIRLPAGDLKDAELSTLLYLQGIAEVTARLEGGGRNLIKQDRNNRPGQTQVWDAGRQEWVWKPIDLGERYRGIVRHTWPRERYLESRRHWR